MIVFDKNPIAGRYFEIKIQPEEGENNHLVEAYIGESLLVRKEIGGCDDPPCHETIYLESHVVGEILTINYKSNLHEEQTFNFNIDNQNLETI